MNAPSTRVELSEPELEPELAEHYLAYVAALGEAFEQLAPWWARLSATHGRKALKLRWPAGPASHPRILAIYREFHARLSSVRPRPCSGPPPRFHDDDAWGSEAEPEPAPLLSPPPERLLIERLQVEAEELYAKMIYLVMSPVGEPPEPRPSMRSLEVIEPDTRRAQAFDFAHRHGTARGVARLLGAGFDLRPRPLRQRTPAEAGEVHRLAYWSYLRDLERALVEAERWWTRELGRRELDELYASSVVGPVGHPRVIGVIQAYWVLCHEINEVLIDPQQHVAPEQLLLDWLRDGRHDSWVDVLAAMPYWPVGVDAEGRWV